MMCTCIDGRHIHVLCFEDCKDLMECVKDLPHCLQQQVIHVAGGGYCKFSLEDHFHKLKLGGLFGDGLDGWRLFVLSLADKRVKRAREVVYLQCN
jgi:hypothetical protein